MSDNGLDPLEEVCPLDSRPWGSHTVTEARACGMALHDFVLPFENVQESGEPVDQEIDTILCGSIIVKAGVIAHPTTGPHPVLVFSFGTTEGPLPDITLVLDETHMRDVRRLVGASIDAAIKAARRAR